MSPNNIGFNGEKSKRNHTIMIKYAPNLIYRLDSFFFVCFESSDFSSYTIM